MKALFVDCGNPVHSYPEGDKTAAALEELELLVSIDFYMTETSRHADYILPAMTFHEREDLTDLWVTNAVRSEEHTSELQSLMRISYAVFCLTKKNKYLPYTYHNISYYNKASTNPNYT